MKKIIILLIAFISLASCSNDESVSENNCNCEEVRLKLYQPVGQPQNDWVVYSAPIKRSDLSCEYDNVKFFENDQSTQNYILIYKGVYRCK